MTVTPMMQQYLSVKERHPDTLVFFRLGDFYELFGDDAKIAAKVLEITLTSRDKASKGSDRLPMCGVPYHAVDGYLDKLIRNGYKVAICEQLEDPKQAKGVVKRDVVRVITPGTYLEGKVEDKRNLYLVSLISHDRMFGLAVVDLSTGEFKLTCLPDQAKIADELLRIAPAEILVPSELSDQLIPLTRQCNATITKTDTRLWSVDSCKKRLLDHFKLHSLRTLGVTDDSMIRAAGAILDYIQQTQQASLAHITQLATYTLDRFLQIDGASSRNLELTKTIREGKKQGSLLGVIDKTITSMGGRLLRAWVEKPLLDIKEIVNRQQAVGCLIDQTFLRLELGELLDTILDLERLLSRIIYGSGNGRDLQALQASLAPIPAIKSLVSTASNQTLQELGARLDPLHSLCDLICSSIVDDPPVSVRDGGLIRAGYNAELDELRMHSKEGKAWISSLEAKERERTGIKSLKVGFNKVFGYYIEITKANIHNAPPDYDRKQTLTNAERFITPALKEQEALILGAEERITELEYNLFCQVREQISSYIEPIQRNAQSLANLDVIYALAQVGEEQQYTCPEIVDDSILEIVDGRHPVIEAMQADFVPNDLYLNQQQLVLLLTGPNMAGKSTYLRQTALIVILAQIGSYIPASQGRIGIVDRIFTRIGAADDLSTGQSTFMVECAETANLLINASKRSLIVLDELGRGTSTFDGMAIAQAVIEYIHNKIKARTLFSTHYHELTKLEQTLSQLGTYQMAVEEKAGQVYFLHKVIAGNADKSYGINVAKMAGIPQVIISRSRNLLYQLEAAQQKPLQLNLFQEQPENEETVTSDVHPLVQELSDLDLNRINPLEAFQILMKWQQQLERRD